MEHVVVGMDEPPAPVEPLTWAADYCRLLECELVGTVALHHERSEHSIDSYEQTVAKAGKRAEAVLGETASGVTHRIELRDGDPRAVIPDIAEDEQAALVVVGARGAAASTAWAWAASPTTSRITCACPS